MSKTLIHFLFPTARNGILRGKPVEKVVETVVVGASDPAISIVTEHTVVEDFGVMGGQTRGHSEVIQSDALGVEVAELLLLI